MNEDTPATRRQKLEALLSDGGIPGAPTWVWVAVAELLTENDAVHEVVADLIDAAHDRKRDVLLLAHAATNFSDEWKALLRARAEHERLRGGP